MQRTKTKARWLVVPALLLLLAACGSDEPASQESSTDAEEEPDTGDAADEEEPDTGEAADDEESDTGEAADTGQGAADENYFEGKQITLTITSSAGGGLDSIARSFASSLSKHLPGNPQVVTSNRDGGGHTVGNNWFQEFAADDGTDLIYTASGALDQQLRQAEAANFDMNEYEPLGALSFGSNAVIVRPDAVEKIESPESDAAIVGDTDGVRPHVGLAVMAARYLGHDYEFAVGYPGGAELEVALLQGEIDVYGTKNQATLDAMVNQDEAAEVLFVMGDTADERRSDFPDAPTLGELLAEADVEIPVDEQAAFDLWFASSFFDHMISAAPGTDPDVLAALRTGFEEAVADPEFIEAVSGITGDQLDTASGEGVKEFLADALNIDESARETLNAIRQDHGLPVAE